jgi:peptidoglycan-associated lipoprotein
MAARNMFINEDIHFDVDKYNFPPLAQQILQRKAEWLRNNPDVSVVIEGHCDERGTNEYNLALGARRAESARAYLINLGIAGSRLTTISYGEERPVDPGHNEIAWAKNRREHFTIE